MDKLRIREVILVEGKYDKNALSQVVDGLILTTGGFEIFKDRDRARLFRRLAEERGVVVLTDADGAGLVIRNHLKSILPAHKVKMAYIPDVPGKERRKSAPGKEGKLGVEGMRPEVLRQALERAGVQGETGDEDGKAKAFTKTTLYELGLTGAPDAARRRRALQRALGLPENLSANALVEVLNVVTTPEEVAGLMGDLEEE